MCVNIRWSSWRGCSIRGSIAGPTGSISLTGKLSRMCEHYFNRRLYVKVAGTVPEKIIISKVGLRSFYNGWNGELGWDFVRFARICRFGCGLGGSFAAKLF